MITTSFDPEADAFYVRFAPPDVKSVDSQEVSPGVTIDLDDEGRMVGVEVLHVSLWMAARPAAEQRRAAE